MSLVFATTNRVNHGSAASLDNMDPCTVIAWVYPTTTAYDFSAIFAKPGTLNRVLRVPGSAGDIQYRVERSSLETQYITTDGPLATANKWYFIAATFDSAAGAADKMHFYVGDLTTAATERAKSVQAEGAGTLDDASGSLHVGNDGPSGTAPFVGRIASVAFFNAVLSLATIQAYQRFPWKALMDANIQLWSEYGNSNAGTQVDWTANTNDGTVTGATVGAGPAMLTRAMLLSN